MSSNPAETLQRCRECGEPAPERARYCAQCGQQIEIRPLRIREILGEVIDSLVSLELPIARTALDLLRGPGRVARAWIDGKRRRYTNPIKFIVIVGLVAALTYEPLYRARVDHIPSGQAAYEVGLAHYSSQYFGFLCIAGLLPLALVLAFVGRLLSVGRRWLEWYVVGLYAYGLGAAGQLLINATAALVPSVSQIQSLPLIEFAVPPVLFCWGAVSFVDRGLRVRALAASFLAQLVLVAAAFVFQALA